MTSLFKKVENLVVWSVLVYEALDFRISPRLLLTSFYIIIVLTFLTLKVTQISFQELVSYSVVGIYSYFSNIVIFVPNMDDVGILPNDYQQIFNDDDINSVQTFGTLLLVSSLEGYRSFFVWTSAVLTLSFIMATLNQNSETTGSYRSLFIFFAIWLLSTFLFTCSFTCSFSNVIIVFIRSDCLFQTIWSLCSRFTTFMNLNIITHVFRLSLFSFLVMYFSKTSVMGLSPLSIVAVYLLFEFCVLSTLNIYTCTKRRNLRSGQLQTCPTDLLEGHSESCPVCLCKMVSAKITQCKHIFHENCLDLCLQRQPTCPVCRHLLLE